MNEPAPLTLARLIELDACPQLELFKATFGESVDLANPPKGYETLGFDWNWAARKLLDAAALTAYEKAVAAARVACNKATAAADAAYNKATTPAQAERKKATAAWAECDKIAAPARAAYHEAVATAWTEREKARAVTFVAGYVATYWRQKGDN